MEIINDFEKRIIAMRLEIADQNNTIDELATSFNYNKQQLDKAGGQLSSSLHKPLSQLSQPVQVYTRSPAPSHSLQRQSMAYLLF